jgi:hypothetical protein
MSNNKKKVLKIDELIIEAEKVQIADRKRVQKNTSKKDNIQTGDTFNSSISNQEKSEQTSQSKDNLQVEENNRSYPPVDPWSLFWGAPPMRPQENDNTPEEEENSPEPVDQTSPSQTTNPWSWI